MISIVAPLYNEGQNVEGLVEHLRDLRGLHEAILVDASDQDESWEILESILESIPESIDRRCQHEPGKPLIRIISTDQPGRSRQMNLGARAATGDILLFLHCDTRLPANAIAMVEREVTRQRQWGRFDVALESKGWIYRLIENMIRIRSRVRPLATGDQGIFVTASLFKRVNGFPPICLMEDVAMSKLLKKHSSPLLISPPVITSARRWQNRGAIRTIFLMWKLRFLFWIGIDPQRLGEMYGNER